MNLRRLLEIATRDMVFKRHLPVQYNHAPIFVTPSGGLKYLYRNVALVDSSLLALASEFAKDGATVWDVGANIGLFAFAAAQRAGSNGHVIAFEPDVWLANLLDRSGAAQPASSAPVTVLPFALASTPGLRNFHLAVRSRATNYLDGYGSTQTGGVRYEKLVMTFTLDQMLDWLPAPTLLKIDVEGAELEVLQGGVQMLGRYQPVVLCEVAGANITAVTHLLHSFGYRLYDADQPPNARPELVIATWNSIAIPGNPSSR